MADPKKPRDVERPTAFVGPPRRPTKEGAPVLVATNPYLAITDGPKKGTEVPILGEKLVLGRGSASDIVVDDEAASRRHAQVYLKSGRWFLKDLGSTNGTHDLKGLLRGTERMLVDGDVFRIGGWEFTFSDPSSAR